MSADRAISRLRERILGRSEEGGPGTTPGPAPSDPSDPGSSERRANDPDRP
jgi:hypothetical protein